MNSLYKIQENDWKRAIINQIIVRRELENAEKYICLVVRKKQGPLLKEKVELRLEIKPTKTSKQVRNKQKSVAL